MTKLKNSKTLLSAGIIMATGMLLGRAAGFIREIILAKYFGVSSEADIAVLMLTLPDLLIALFIGGATSIVLIPLFQETEKKNQFSSFVFFSVLIFVSFSIMSAGLYFFTQEIVQLLAPGLNHSSQEIAHNYLKWVLLAVPITALASVSRAYLQSSHRFAMTSLENLFYNIAVILGVALFTASLGLEAILFAIFAGVFMRWFSQFCNILSYSEKQVQFRAPPFGGKLFKNYVQALGAGMSLIFLPFIARSIASLLMGDGAIAIFNYSYKLIELPFGVAISVFSIVIFPKLSQMVKDNEKRESINKLFSQSLFLLYCFCVPICIGLMGLFTYLNSIQFTLFDISHSAFSDICLLATLGFLVLPIRGFSSLHLAIFSARKDTRTPFIINTTAVILSIPLCYFATRFFGNLEQAVFGLGLSLILVYFFIYLSEVTVLHTKYSINAVSEFFSWRSLKVLSLSLIATLPFIALSQNHSFSAISALALSGVYVVSCFLLMVSLDKNFKEAVLKKLIRP